MRRRPAPGGRLENGASGRPTVLARRVLRDGGMGPRRFVYVIQSTTRADRRYIGRTADMPSRLASHNAGDSPHTCHHRPWRLVVSVAFASEARAMEFEKYLKSGSGADFVARYFA